MASDDQCSVADDERVLIESARHSVHATSKHARAVKGNMGAQEQSFSKKSTEDRIATQRQDSSSSFRSPLHDTADSTVNGEKLATPATTMAQKVFETAELLEMILLQLGAKDILTAQQVGREWRDAVNGSMILKRRLGIELDDVDKVPYHSPFRLDPFMEESDLKPLAYNISPDWNVSPGDPTTLELAEKRFRICVKWQPPEQPLRLRVGSRCRAMRLCHPPLEHARVEVYRSGEPSRASRDGDWESIKLEKPDGITIGDVLDVAYGKYPESQSPRNALRLMSLKGYIELSENDPMVKKGIAKPAQEALRVEGHNKSSAIAL